jgi:hypothetical protein
MNAVPQPVGTWETIMLKKKKAVKIINPLTLLLLSGCGGISGLPRLFDNESQIMSTVSGRVIKGPLEKADVFLDFNGNEKLDYGEPLVETHADGSFDLTTGSTSYNIVALTDEGTLDTSSGSVLSGITLTAPQGATVITPTTTLMQEGGLTAAQVAAVLGVPDGVDLLTFNPYAIGVNTADALAVEIAAQQVVAVVTAFAGAPKGQVPAQKMPSLQQCNLSQK